MMPRNVSPIRRATHVPMDRDQYVPSDMNLYHNIYFGLWYGAIGTGILLVSFGVGVLVGVWFW